MARIEVEFDETTLVNDDGREVAGVTATCGQCRFQTESYGTGPRSRMRCIMLLKEECPEGAGDRNYYVDPDA